MCFVEGIIGVPAVALINWDDDYIHSSQDDLFQIDQTQLQRNNFIVASMAYKLSFAKPSDVPLFATETYAQGVRRLANDLRVAMELIRTSNPADGWSDAMLLVEQGIQREQRALNSIRVFAEGNRGALQTIDLLDKRIQEQGSVVNADLRGVYKQVHGSDPARKALSSAEKAASGKIPVNVSNLEEYFGNRQKIGFRAGGHLHGLMRAEVYNFIDGKRSYYDIYKAVRAEALAAGSWYYGTVQFEDVVSLLDAGVETKAWSLR